MRAQLPTAKPIIVKVAVVMQDPVLPGYHNKRLHEVVKTPGYTFAWNDPFVLNREYEAALEKLSHGVVQFEVVQIIDDGKFFSRRNDNNEMVSTEDMIELLLEPGWNYERELYTQFDKTHPGEAMIGNNHFPPNGMHDYDWVNKTIVNTYADGWFSHLPHFEGINPDDGHLNNWWHYVVNWEEARKLESRLKLN